MREPFAGSPAIWMKMFLAFLVPILLSACEARLDLDQVDKTSAMPIQRFDQFQAVANQENVLIAVSSTGAVVVSADGADHWSRHELPGAPVLIDLASCPDGSFAALDAGRRVWLSFDGGRTWEKERIDTDESVTALTCGPDNRLWVAGSFSTIIASADLGKTWEANSLGEDAILTDIQFVDDEFAVAFGEFGMVISSLDGGETWEVGPSLPNDFYPQAALFLDRRNGLAVGLSGGILSTKDGGETWEYEATGMDTPLYGLTRKGNDIFAVGEGGEMLRNSGDRWERVSHGKPVRSYLRAVTPIDGHHLLVAGGTGALHRISLEN